MLHRLDDNWRKGTNTFSRRGEILFGAFSGDALVGICGRNIDPYGHDEAAGRVRHLYVQTACRRSGVGRLLVETIASDAAEYFDRLNARALQGSLRFYERLGFMRIENDPHVTHRLPLHEAVTRPTLALPSP